MSLLQFYGVGTRVTSVNFVKKSNRFLNRQIVLDPLRTYAAVDNIENIRLTTDYSKF